MEERKSWLPAGLEGSGWEPDDRASQRSGAGSKRSGGDAGASSSWEPPKAEKPAEGGSGESSGTWQPYDPARPESKRARKSSESETAQDSQAAGRGQRDRSQDDRGRDEPKGDRDRSEDDRGEDERKGDRDRDAEQEGRSDVDAMGQDKHRPVVGQRYGASRTKQLAYYGVFVAFVIGAYFGLKIAVDNLDKAPAHDRDQAPWSQPNAPDEPLGGFTPKDKGAKGPTNFQ